MDQPLAGRTVVVTRASAQASAFVIELESYGAGVILCPTIEITDPESYERLDEAIDQFQQALKLQPAFVDAQRNLAKLRSLRPTRQDRR